VAGSSRRAAPPRTAARDGPGRIQAFERRFFDPERRFSRIGGGGLGGKAQGLLLAKDALARRGHEIARLGFDVDVPALVIVGTDVFDAFLERNRLPAVVAEGRPDDEIALAFTRAALPAEWIGDLRALAEEARLPLAVRSSSALEDALGQPFAGVYGTKMVPGSQKDPGARVRALVDALKFVYASTFFHGAEAYRRATGHAARDEKMAVIVQEVVGRAHDPRFYPDVSGVARSRNDYPTGHARREEGIVHLALGLGKTIVEGGLCWSFSPPYPRAVPPFNSVRDLVNRTQSAFWAINIGAPPAYDPMRETEYLVRLDLAAAEEDDTLRGLASTFDPGSDRLTPGTARPGPRVLDFAPLLGHGEPPLAPALAQLLEVCAEAAGGPVELEFALTLTRGRPRLGLLQVRPLWTSTETVEVTEEEMEGASVLLASRETLGNGCRLVEDVVFVDPGAFDARMTPAIAEELASLNAPLVASGRPYLLIGFGRWGSGEPWLGVPVRWDQIAGATAIVEAALPSLAPDPSLGSHFFHNVSSGGVLYFTMRADAAPGIDWTWLASREVVARTEHVRHVRTAPPLEMKADGRSGRGLVRRTSKE